MSMLEQKFKTWLKEQGLKPSTIYDYNIRLIRFCRHNGYDRYEDLADDVFILLDKGIHSGFVFGNDFVQEIENYETVLKNFNGFLFDIGYKRDFGIPYASSMDIAKVLTTFKKYEPGKQPRTVHDDVDEDRTEFTFGEVFRTLHISERMLRYWAETGKRPRQHKDKYGRIFYKKDEINEFLLEWYEKKDSKTRDKFMRP